MNSLREILRTTRGDQFDVDEATGCWVWNGPLTVHGYPYSYQHRRFWEAVNGPRPDGHHIHHLCRNRACVNPDHLESLPERQHLKIHYLDEKAGLTFDDVRAIRELGTRMGVSARQVAAQYGVSWFTVYRYWRGESWAPEGHGEPVKVEPAKCRRAGCNNSMEGRNRQAKWCSPYCRTTANRERDRAKYNARMRAYNARKKKEQH